MKRKGGEGVRKEGGRKVGWKELEKRRGKEGRMDGIWLLR